MLRPGRDDDDNDDDDDDDDDDAVGVPRSPAESRGGTAGVPSRFRF
jgi:hypothetical protein